MDLFTNREIATIFWFIVIIIVFSFKKRIRVAVSRTIKCALKTKLILYFLSYLFYLFLIINFFYRKELWDIVFFKESIFWFVFSGLPISSLVIVKKLEKGFWKRIILNNLKLIVFLEFLISSFTFSLPTEMFIVPFISIIVMLNTYSKHYDKYKDAETYTGIILMFFGSLVIIYSLHRFLHEIILTENDHYFKGFLLPVVYSVISIPYMYILRLYVAYEQIFVWLNINQKISQKVKLLIKLRLLLFCNINMKKLQIATNMNNFNLLAISSEDEIEDMIKSYKNGI